MSLVYFLIADEDDYKNWNDYSSKINSFREKVILSIIMLMQVLAPIAGIYWQYSRCMTVIGLDKWKTALKIKTNALFFVPFIFVMIWDALFTVFLDGFYFELLYLEIFTNPNILEGTIFSSKPYLYLVLQLGILLVLNLFFIIASVLANKYRKNFRETDILLDDTNKDFAT